MSIENEILRALGSSHPGSKQRIQAESLKVVFDSLVADGFKDVGPETQGEILDKEMEEFRHSAFIYYPKESFFVRRTNDKEVRLTLKENQILKLLAQNYGRLVGFVRLYNILDYGDIIDEERNSSYLKMIVMRLRRKLEPDAMRDEFRYLVSVRGVGYKLSDPNKLITSNSETIFDSGTHLILHSRDKS